MITGVRAVPVAGARVQSFPQNGGEAHQHWDVQLLLICGFRSDAGQYGGVWLESYVAIATLKISSGEHATDECTTDCSGPVETPVFPSILCLDQAIWISQ